MLLIPLRSDLPFFDMQVPLDDVTYTLEFRWNVRANGWYMNVLDEQAENMISAGLRLVVDFPLAAYQTGRKPPGVFLVSDTSGQGLDPGLNDLGDRVQLYYFEAADIGARV